MQRLFLLFFLAFFISFGVVALDVPLSHATSHTAPPKIECAGTGVCIPSNTGLPEGSIQGILAAFMFWLLAIVGMIAIIAFVISGMQYLASVGDPKLAETAKKNMVNSIIGIVVALSGFVILQAIATLLDNNPADKNIF
jgi:hypothetical protein